MRITPEPDPLPPLPDTLIFTTEGSTASAAAWTEPSVAAGAGAASSTGEALAASVVDVPEEAGSGPHSCHAAAPPTPEAPPTSTQVASTAAARPVRRRGGGGGAAYAGCPDGSACQIGPRSRVGSCWCSGVVPLGRGSGVSVMTPLCAASL